MINPASHFVDMDAVGFRSRKDQRLRLAAALSGCSGQHGNRSSTKEVSTGVRRPLLIKHRNLSRKASNADRRSKVRHKLRLAVIGMHNTNDGDALVHDMSMTGLLIQTRTKMAAKDNIAVELPEVGTVSAIVIWRDGDFYGCEFAEPLPSRAVSAALLRSPFQRSGTEVDADHSAASIETPVESSTTVPFATRVRVALALAAILWGLVGLLIAVM